MYTRNHLRGFWDSILINGASRTALKKFSQSFVVHTTTREGTNGSHYYNPRTGFFVDEPISPGYVKDHYLDTFRPVVYVLEHCGIYFSVFLFIKLIIDMVVKIVRYIEVDKMTGSTIGFGETLWSASYLLFLTILTSIYNPRALVLAGVEHTEVGSSAENGTHEVKADAKRKKEHLSPAMSTVKLPLSPAQPIR